jgi:hypothetical protein
MIADAEQAQRSLTPCPAPSGFASVGLSARIALSEYVIAFERDPMGSALCTSDGTHWRAVIDKKRAFP